MRPIFLIIVPAILFFYCTGCKKAVRGDNPATDTTNKQFSPTNKPAEVRTFPYVDTFIGGLSAKLVYDAGPTYYDRDAAYQFYVRHLSNTEVRFFSSRVIFMGLEYPREFDAAFSVDTSNEYGSGGDQFRLVGDTLYVSWSDFYHHKGGQGTGGFVDADGVFAGKRIDHSPR